MNNKKEDIASRILEYIQKNPDAGDTLEGIVRWWLDSEMINKSVEEVAKALEALIEKGLLKKVKLSNGKLIYKVHDKL